MTKYLIEYNLYAHNQIIFGASAFQIQNPVRRPLISLFRMFRTSLLGTYIHAYVIDYVNEVRCFLWILFRQSAGYFAFNRIFISKAKNYDN